MGRLPEQVRRGRFGMHLDMTHWASQVRGGGRGLHLDPRGAVMTAPDPVGWRTIASRAALAAAPSWQTQVLVVGGGPAGTAAAVAAARGGAEVLLVERFGFLGGNLTAAMVAPMMGFHAGDLQIVRGIPDEVVGAMVAMGASPGHVPDPVDFCHTITPFDYEALKRVLHERVLGAGVRVLFHTLLVGAEVGLGPGSTVWVWQRDGFRKIEARIVVDASGDGEFCALAGLPFEVGRPADGLTQPMSMLFRLLGVNWDRIMDYLEAHPDQMQHEAAAGGWIDPGRVRRLPIRGFSAFQALMREARASGELDIPRDRLLVFEGVSPGEAIVNSTRVARRSGIVGPQLSDAEVEARRQVYQLMDFLPRRVPGFENARLVGTPVQLGIRETRRVVGVVMVTEDDALCGRRFPDAVAACAYPIDIHDPATGGMTFKRFAPGEYFTIPYRALLPRGARNVLVAGRCFSGTHEALASARISAVAMAMGQAAGTAAAMAARSQVAVERLDPDDLRRRLTADGAFVPGVSDRAVVNP
ncbi:MAG: FAD-dependent oxidoreductase [Armatimonadota bacterium]|nr:FAD-dependent oxidoreductase [Armatimonadota bacterium]